MRIKNADKIKKQDSEATPEACLEAREKFRYGNKCDSDALIAVHNLHAALNLKSPVPPLQPFDKGIFDKYRERFWRYVATNYEKSWAKHDGTFFRNLAAAMEVHLRPNDPVWTCVGDEIIVCRMFERQIPTVTEMHHVLTKRGITATRKTVERIYAFFGIKRTAKRGPRTGAKQKSAAQGGESLR